MTVQVIDGMTELHIPFHTGILFPLAVNSITVNAATEAAHFCGRAWLPGRTGTKTISSAGGKIHWAVGAITWANSATRLRVGVQPLATSTSPLHGTGTFSVYHEMIPGTDTLSANTWVTTAMSSGTMDITHNEEICIAIDMTVLGGADSIVVRSASAPQIRNFPGVTAVTSGPTYTAQSAVPNAIIEFDDGTFGFVNCSHVHSNALTSIHTANTGTNPDEYCNIFQFPSAHKVEGLWCVADNNTLGEFELILYSDPEGTPATTADKTILVDADMVNTTSARPLFYPLNAVVDIAANTKYAVAIRPTTATSVDIPYLDVGAAAQMVAHPLGTNCYQGHRQNQTGAFTTTTTRRIYAGVTLSGASDDSAVGGSGGGMRIVGPGGLAG